MLLGATTCSNDIFVTCSFPSFAVCPSGGGRPCLYVCVSTPFGRHRHLKKRGPRAGEAADIIVAIWRKVDA